MLGMCKQLYCARALITPADARKSAICDRAQYIFPALTEREREILHLIARGQSNAEIARELAPSPKTVYNYVSNILSKLQVADRAQAIIRAREAGLGK